MLHRAYGDGARPRPLREVDPTLPSGMQTALQQFLFRQAEVLQFADLAEMQTFLGLVRKERTGLELLLEPDHLPAWDSLYHERLQRYLVGGRESGKGRKGGSGGATPGPSSIAARDAKLTLMLLRRMAKILPAEVARARRLEGLLKDRLALLRQKKAAINGLQRSLDADGRVARRCDAFAAWLPFVVPATDAYSKISADLVDARRELEDLRKQHNHDDDAAQLQALTGQYQDLLTLTMVGPSANTPSKEDTKG